MRGLLTTREHRNPLSILMALEITDWVDSRFTHQIERGVVHEPGSDEAQGRRSGTITGECRDSIETGIGIKVI